SDYDVRQRFVTSFLYAVPAPSRGPAKLLLGGWQLNGIFSAQTGTPFTVTSGKDQALSGAGGAQRPNLVGDPRLDASRPRGQLVQQYYNFAAFGLPAVGQYGNLGRNTMNGPGSYNLDGSIFRGFPLRERLSLQFRAEFFNALNHANLANPVSNIGAAAVGRILSVIDPRILQFGLELIYRPCERLPHS